MICKSICIYDVKIEFTYNCKSFIDISGILLYIPISHLPVSQKLVSITVSESSMWVFLYKNYIVEKFLSRI